MSEFRERRQYKRLNLNFSARLSKMGSDFPILGTTRNLSQGGTLIETSNWRALQLRNRVLVTLFIPPTFSGQDITIGLQGKAVVTRFDQSKENVVIQFVKTFRQFERIEEPSITSLNR